MDAQVEGGGEREEEMEDKEGLQEERWEEVEEEQVGEKVAVGGTFQAVSMEISEAPPRSVSPPSPSSLQGPAGSLEGWAGPALGAGRVGLRILSWRW